MSSKQLTSSFAQMPPKESTDSNTDSDFLASSVDFDCEKKQTGKDDSHESKEWVLTKEMGSYVTYIDHSCKQFINHQTDNIRKDHPGAKGQVPFLYLQSLLSNSNMNENKED